MENIWSYEFFTKQFQRRKFLFRCENPSVFGKPQCGRHQVLYIIYRLIVACWWLGVQILDHPSPQRPQMKHIFFTVWSYTMVSISCWLQLATAIHSFYISYKNKSSNEKAESLNENFTKSLPVSGKLPVLYLINWVFYYVALDAALMVSIFYWPMLYHGGPILLWNFIVHGLNGIYVVVDMFITGVPVQILHVYVPMIYLITYSIYTFILCEMGVICSIYPFLNYNADPDGVLLFILVANFIALPGVHLLGFLLFWTRSVVYATFLKSCNIKPNDNSRSEEYNTLGKQIKIEYDVRRMT